MNTNWSLGQEKQIWGPNPGKKLASEVWKERIRRHRPGKKKIFKTVCQIKFKEQKIILEKVKKNFVLFNIF